MGIDFTRRGALCGGALLLASAVRADDDISTLARLEASSGGRLGVTILDLASGRRLTHRAEERFPLCSTFKLLAGAFALARVDRGLDRLDARIVFGKDDLVPYSPITGTRVGGDGMTVAEICEAAITLSDNTAGNLLLDRFGGPAGLTGFLRGLGDPITRLDRREPALNESAPGDPRDTTTPAAMAETMHRLLFGDALSSGSQQVLKGWLLASRTGGERLRAGCPADWQVGDKTGTGENAVTNDVAVLWPPDKVPMIVTAFYAQSSIPPERRNDVLAHVGRFAVAMREPVKP